MDMAWLDDVLVLLEEQNLTRAAARRNITQPAFSRRIRSFEHWLGRPILDRQKNRITLSPALTEHETEIRALVARLSELRRNLALFESARPTIAIAAQHAALVSSFPDMALRAKRQMAQVRFRPRAGNLHDCVTRFLRGDAEMLLCYDSPTLRPVEFGAGVARGVWGSDYLVPVVGGGLRYTVRDSGTVPEDSPAIVYPEDSFFGEVLARAGRAFATPRFTRDPVCVTAFSSGTRELVLQGLGVGWLPFSMVHREIASGALISLAQALGQEPLSVTLFAHRSHPAALRLLDLWSNQALATMRDAPRA